MNNRNKGEQGRVSTLRLRRLVILIMGLLLFSGHVYSAAEEMSYSYDTNGRLMTTDSRSGRVSYQYDAQGNQLARINEGNVNGILGTTPTSQITTSAGAYSNNQGAGNWYYQQWDGSKYSNMQYKNGHWEGASTATFIEQSRQHPDQNDSVRKWIAPMAGMIYISGNVAKYDPNGGDGVTVSVLKNKVVIWSKQLRYNDTAGYNLTLTAGVSQGDVIYFVVNRNGDNSYDTTSWNPSIAYLDGHAAEVEYGSTQGANNWYYQQWNGTEYAALQYKNQQWEGTTPFTLILGNFQHPNDTDSVRTWQAPKSGLIRIAGNVAKENIDGGDGVMVSVKKNGIILWSKHLDYNDANGYELNLTVAVTVGDRIYFSVNRNADSTYDGTLWKPVIAYLDAHATDVEYSNIQGTNNWYYQQWNGSAYTNLQYKNNQWEGSTATTLILKDFQHPDQNDSVRTWSAPKSGMIHIAGNVAKVNKGGGNGIKAYIRKNNSLLWSQTVAFNDITGYEAGLTIGVSKGDAIRFIVNSNGDSTYDGTRWNPVIAYLDAYSAEEQYSNIQGADNWYYQQWDGMAYSNLTFQNDQWQGVTPFTLIKQSFYHPDQTDSVRKWVAPYSGTIRITGNVAKESTDGGDGIIATLLKNSTRLWKRTIAYNDSTGVELNLMIEVTAGDAIYFRVNKNGDSSYDGTFWSTVIAYQ